MSPTERRTDPAVITDSNLKLALYAGTGHQTRIRTPQAYYDCSVHSKARFTTCRVVICAFDRIPLPTLASPAPHNTEHCSTLSLWTGRLFLWLFRWKVVGDLPPDRHMVIVAAPHTSTMDGFVMLAVSWYWGVRLRWLVKHSLFKSIASWALLRSGAIPVDRNAPGGLVQGLVARFTNQTALTLAIPPSGTRSRQEYWRSGFYHVAHSAGVPLVLSFVDYRTRTTGVGPTLHLSGNVKADMDKIRAFYAPITARYPDQAGIPRLREEDEAEA